MSKKTQGPQIINWCWTLNNYTDAEEILLKSLVLTDKVKYICWGKEVGENGTKHLQGYCELKNRQYLAGVKKILLSRMHLEKRLGTQQQAIDYCKKDGVYVEFGEKQEQSGTTLSEKDNLIQNRLKSIQEKVKKGVSEKQLYEEEPLMAARFPKFISKCTEWIVPPIREELVVELHVGPTGSGKTTQAFQRFPNSLYNMPVKSGQTLWFNGYHGQEVVLLDDFKGGFGLDNLLRLLDKFPIQVEQKGSMTWFTPLRIIITSNFKELEWYDYINRNEHYLALRRRIHERFIWDVSHKSERCDSDWVPIPFAGVVVRDTVESDSSDSEELSLTSQYQQRIADNLMDFLEEGSPSQSEEY